MVAPRREPVESWNITGAALAGFISGAGLMSHSDMIQIYSREFYNFLDVNNGNVIIYGRQMMAITLASVAYMFVLLIIGCMAADVFYRYRDSWIRIVALGGMLLIISFIGTSSYALSRGYYDIDKKLETLRNDKSKTGDRLVPVWQWK